MAEMELRSKLDLILDHVKYLVKTVDELHAKVDNLEEKLYSMRDDTFTRFNVELEEEVHVSNWEGVQ